MSKPTVNNHFVLSVIAVILSCLGGFWAIALAVASLVMALRTSDLIYQERAAEAQKTAWWAGLFGWLTVLFVLLPVIAAILFSGTILALLGAALAAG